MAVNLSPIGGVAGQFFDNNGQPLSGGKIYTYAAGTTTPQASYTSATGITPHSNPIILDSAGRVPGGEIWLTDGLVYKFVIETSTAILIGTYDNIVGINSNFVNYAVQEEVQTATAGQTVFTLTTINYAPGTNSLSVFIDGVNQYVGDSYLETDSTTVTFTSGLHVGAEVKFTTAVTLSSGTTTADLVAYDPPFTGSVATNVEDKLAQYVSVKDFGAIGDGVADDTVAIQAAVAASDGIYVPAGTYLVSEAIELTGGKRLYGDGKGRSSLKRTDTTPQTIGGESVVAILYMSSRYNSVDNLGLIGDRTGTSTTASVDGVHFGNLIELTNNSSFANIRIANCNRALNCSQGAFMTIFDQITCQDSVKAYDFSSPAAKTSLTFNSCWAENCGQAYDFQFTIYSTLNSCGADYANYTSTGNPYGFGFGSRSSNKGVYNFITSDVTLNSCGAEYSYGDGVFKFNGACQAVINSPNQFGCSSEYVPNYGSYGDVAVGPIQCEVTGPINLLTISSPRDMDSWTNPAVAVGHPTRPISKLLAFNYLEGTYGALTSTPAVITSAANSSSDLIKGIGSDKYCVAVNQLKRDPVILGTMTQGGVQSRGVTLTGTGTIISIPFVSQTGRNFKHTFRIFGQRTEFNSNIPNSFSATFGVSSLNTLNNLTSGNLFNVTSVAINGMSLEITITSGIVEPTIFMEIISESIALIDFANITLT